MTTLSIVEMNSDLSVQDAELETQIQRAWLQVRTATNDKYAADHAADVAARMLDACVDVYLDLRSQRRQRMIDQLEKEKLDSVIRD